jgi:hypothetical protein
MTTTSASQDAVATVSPERIYAEVRAGIRETDAISFKLLGLVPLVSGATLIGLVLQTRQLQPGVVVLLALFAAGITLGLFRWELRNVQTCRWLIKYVDALEAQALAANGVGDVLRRRPDSPQWVGKAAAEKLIYTTTITAWLALPIAMDVLPASPFGLVYFVVAGIILLGTVISLFAKPRALACPDSDAMLPP